MFCCLPSSWTAQAHPNNLVDACRGFQTSTSTFFWLEPKKPEPAVRTSSKRCRWNSEVIQRQKCASPTTGIGSEREREEQLRELQNQPEPLTNQQQTAAAEVDRNDFFQIHRHYQAVLTMIRENAAWAIHTDQPHTARSKFVISWEFLSYASSTTCDL